LKEIEANCQTIEFVITYFKQMEDALLKGADTLEIITKIENSIIPLSAFNSNRFDEKFKKNVEL
jgi:dynein heavy chain